MTDKNIKRWTFDVQVKDSGQFVRQYPALLGVFLDDLRERGYVQVLDLDPYILVEYDEGKDVFNYVLTIQTVYLGRKQAWDTAGLLHGQLVQRSTRDHKSAQ